MGEVKQLLTKIILEYYSQKNYSFEDIYDQKFILENNLTNLWNKRENKNDKWESFVKFVLFDQGEKRYISERIMHLLFDAQNSLDQHFVISTEAGKFTLPDRLSEFLRLRSLSLGFFKIYRAIMNRINFDYPQRKFSGKHIRGRIDWNKTLRDSIGVFPINFHARSWVREFDTPENRLLLLCATWIKHDSIRILKSNFKEPLSVDEKEILIDIYDSASNTISHFPFSDVVKQVHGLENLRKDSPMIVNLRRDVNKRILEGKIKNPKYGDLQRWIGQYLDLSPEGITHNSQMFVVENMTNIDKLYEILIFLEFYLYLKNVKHCNPKLVLYDSKNYKIIFPIGQKKVEFYHDLQFELNDNSSRSWALTSRPDYTAIIDKEIIGVFDAKNYFKVNKKLKENFEKYSRTLKCFNHLKQIKIGEEDEFIKKWDDVVDSKIVYPFSALLKTDQTKAVEYCNELIQSLKTNNEKMLHEYDEQKNKSKEQRNEATIKILSYIVNLDVNYGGLIFPKEDYKSFTYPDKKTQDPRFHRNMMVEHLRLDYDENNAKETRDSTVKRIYDAIKFGIESQPIKKELSDGMRS